MTDKPPKVFESGWYRHHALGNAKAHWYEQGWHGFAVRMPDRTPTSLCGRQLDEKELQFFDPDRKTLPGMHREYCNACLRLLEMRLKNALDNTRYVIEANKKGR